MGKKKQDIPKGEERIFLRNSRMIYFKYYLMAFILLALGIYVVFAVGTEFAYYAFYASIVFLIVIISFTEGHRTLNIYEITPDYINHHFGIIAKNTKSVNMGTISDFIIKQNLWQRLLNYGTIESHRYTDGSAMDISLKGIPNPNKYADLLQNILESKMSRHKDPRTIFKNIQK